MENLELIAPTLVLILNLFGSPALPPFLPNAPALNPPAVAEQVLPAEDPSAVEIAEAPQEPEFLELVESPEAVPAAQQPQKAPRRQRTVKPPVLHLSGGLTGTFVTRIIKQTARSNFVFEDYMAGVFVNIKTVPLKPINFMARVGAYYPLLAYFNNFPQPSNNPLHFAADLTLGPVFEPVINNTIRFNLAPSLHLFFQNSDRWNYLHLGLAAVAGVELPITLRWIIYIDGLASLDYGSLGNNKTIEPLDIVYQYQFGIGFHVGPKVNRNKAL